MNRPVSQSRATGVPGVGFLDGPIALPMLRLAAPTTLVMGVQVFVGMAEAYFVGYLGTQALAAVAMVFPVLMLMQMVANGGVGGGVASAIARARGGGRGADVRALVWHSVLLAVVLGAATTALAIGLGPLWYAAMGDDAVATALATSYSHATFAGAVAIWLVALLSSALRGAGDARVPALVTIGSAVVLVPLSPALIFGWGPFPRMGIAGGGAAFAIFYSLAAAILLAYLRSPRSPLQLVPGPLERRLFREILGVGALSSLAAIQINVMFACLTAAAGTFGAAAIAGYGIASRLDYVLAALLFGLGTAAMTMVGTNVGAGQMERAWRIAWTGGALGFLAMAAIGLLAAAFPLAWMGMFSDDARVLATGADYLRTVGPAFGFVGLASTIYYASVGAKHVLLPLLAGTARMTVAGLFGWFAVARLGMGLPGLFYTIAAAAVLFGLLAAATMFASYWGRAPRAATAGSVEASKAPRAT